MLREFFRIDQEYSELVHWDVGYTFTLIRKSVQFKLYNMRDYFFLLREIESLASEKRKLRLFAKIFKPQRETSRGLNFHCYSIKIPFCPSKLKLLQKQFEEIEQTKMRRRRRNNMGKVTLFSVGNIKVKMDTKDDFSYDAKEPHVSFEEHGVVTVNHIKLADVDNLVGRTPDEKKAIEKLRDNKDEYIREYHKNNW